MAISQGAPFGRRKHDHGRCIERALGRAEKICAKSGARLTPIRRRVLEIVWRSHVPVGAYDILRHLDADVPGAMPPTVYRALDFLRNQGLVHRIESLNAYIGCCDPGAPHTGQFLICRDCGLAMELRDPVVNAAIGARAAEIGFAVEQETVEVSGLCPDCRRGAC